MSRMPFRTQILLLASILVVGCRGDLVAGRVNPREVTGSMTLQVVVRDDRGFVGTGALIEGAEVSIDDATGHWGGTTDQDGSLVIEGVPTDGSASLTVWAEGYPALSILGLGADGLEVPSPLEIGLGTLGYRYCSFCSQNLDHVTGEILGRVDPPSSPVAVSLPGAWSVSTSASYVVPLGRTLEPTQRMVGIELDETDEGARILSYAQEVWDGGLEGPPLRLGPGETGQATVEIQTSFDPDGVLHGSDVQVAIVDEVWGGIPSALLGLSRSPRAPGSTLVEYALLPGAGETMVSVEALNFEAVGALSLAVASARGRPDEGPLVLREPPHLAVAPGEVLDLANEPVEFDGAQEDWASARYLRLSSEGEVLWVVLPPKGATSVRLPPAPSVASSWPDVVYVVAAGARWTSDPWQEYRLVEPGWARSQLLELAADASVEGRLRPVEPPPDPGPYVTDCGGTDELEVLVVDNVPRFADGALNGIEVVVDCAAGRLRPVMTDEQGHATFTGLDFANDPPNVSAIDPAGSVATRVALGFDRPVPRPYVIDLYRAFRDQLPPSVPVTIERSAAGNEVYCWSTGSLRSARFYVSAYDEPFLHGSSTFDAGVYEELSPARVGCLEIDGTADGPRTMVAFGETEVRFDQETASLALDDAVPWERSSIRIDHRDERWSARSLLRAFVEDEREGDRDRDYGLPVGMNEGSEIGDDGIDTIGLAWVPGAGTEYLRVHLSDFDDLGGLFGWRLNIPMVELSADQQWEAKAPPRVSAVGEGAERALLIEGAEDWAQDYYVLYAGRYDYFVPVGWPTIRIGRTPDDLSPAADTAFIRAHRYDEPLGEQDHWTGEWWNQHLREMAYHAAVDP